MLPYTGYEEYSLKWRIRIACLLQQISIKWMIIVVSAPENVLVEEGGNYSQNSMIQDISYRWKRLFLMHCHHEFFNASPFIFPKKAINNIQKKKTKKKSGVYVNPSERRRYSSKCIISLDESIL